MEGSSTASAVASRRTRSGVTRRTVRRPDCGVSAIALAHSLRFFRCIPCDLHRRDSKSNCEIQGSFTAFRMTTKNKQLQRRNTKTNNRNGEIRKQTTATAKYENKQLQLQRRTCF